MAGDNSSKPGEIVKVSDIYSVVHDDGKDTFEVTCVEGEHFPPTRSGKGAHFQLKIRGDTFAQAWRPAEHGSSELAPMPTQSVASALLQ